MAGSPTKSLRPLTSIIFSHLHRQPLASCVVFSFFNNLFMLVVPIYTMQIYNRVLPARSVETLILLSSLVIGLLAAFMLLDVVRSWLLLRYANQFEKKWLAHVVDLTLRTTGIGLTSTNSIRDLETIRSFLSSKAVVGLLDLIWTPIFLFAICLLHPMLGVMTVSGAIVLSAIAMFADQVVRAHHAQVGTLNTLAMENLAGAQRDLETLAAMAMIAPIRARLLDTRREISGIRSIAAHREALAAALGRGARLLLQVVLLATAAVLALQSSVAAGSIAAASMLASRALAPIEQASEFLRQLMHAHEAYRRLKDLSTGAARNNRRTLLPIPTGTLSIDKVVIWPPSIDNRPIQKNIELTLEPGQILGVTGPTATGKSLLARYIVGTMRPHSGSIRLDAADVQDWNQEQLGRFIGYLPQEPKLLHGMIKENIARFGDPDDSEVVRAAQSAGAHELIMRLPKGYETQIDPGASHLSSGMRQRIALARAFYGMPTLIVLDQPYTHLDGDGIGNLNSMLERMRDKNRTIVIVTTSGDIYRFADYILLLEVGRSTLIKPAELRRYRSHPKFADQLGAKELAG